MKTVLRDVEDRYREQRLRVGALFGSVASLEALDREFKIKSEKFALAIGLLDIAQPNTMGGQWLGLDATPTGSNAAFDVVADFTGATETLFTTPSITVPVTATHSQTDGSQFKINHEGIWEMTSLVECITAATVRAGLGIDNVAGDLSIDPVLTTRTVDIALRIAAGVDSDPVKMVSGGIGVTRNMAKDATLGLARLLLSNGAGAGAAAASLSLTLCYFKLTRLGNLPRALSGPGA